MSAISPVVTCSTLFEYHAPDGRIQPLIYTRLATPEERQRIIDGERGDDWARREAGLPPLPAPSRDLGRVAV